MNGCVWVGNPAFVPQWIELVVLPLHLILILLSILVLAVAPMVGALFSPFTWLWSMSWIWWCYYLKNLPHTCCSISLGSKKRSQSTHTCAKPLIQSLKAGCLSQLSHGMTDHSLCRVPMWFRGCCTADDDSTQQALHELSPMPLCCCTHTTEG